MEFTYDGLSLPMLWINGKLFRVQILRNGNWKTLETEEEYEQFFNKRSMTKTEAILICEHAIAYLYESGGMCPPLEAIHILQAAKVFALYD